MKKHSKNVIIKQPWALGAFFACSGIAFLVMVICAADGTLLVRLLWASVLAVPTWAVALYFFTWTVALSSKRIICRVFFFTREYSYGNIMSATEYHSSKPSSSLRITFSDGKRISIPDYCTNYESAKREIMRHISIKISYL